MMTRRVSFRRVAMSRIANAFWYVDLDEVSITAGRDTSILPWAPAPIMYRSAIGNSRIFFIANGIRRSSPVSTNMLSLG